MHGFVRFAEQRVHRRTARLHVAFFEVPCVRGTRLDRHATESGCSRSVFLVTATPTDRCSCHQRNNHTTRRHGTRGNARPSDIIAGFLQRLTKRAIAFRCQLSSSPIAKTHATKRTEWALRKCCDMGKRLSVSVAKANPFLRICGADRLRHSGFHFPGRCAAPALGERPNFPVFKVNVFCGRFGSCCVVPPQLPQSMGHPTLKAPGPHLNAVFEGSVQLTGSKGLATTQLPAIRLRISKQQTSNACQLVLNPPEAAHFEQISAVASTRQMTLSGRSAIARISVVSGGPDPAVHCTAHSAQRTANTRSNATNRERGCGGRGAWSVCTMPAKVCETRSTYGLQLRRLAKSLRTNVY
jgi:hypothetical protein